MLLETRVNDRLTLLVDCENSGGVEKNALTANAHPDKILDSAIAIIRGAAVRFGEGLSLEGQPAPVMLEVEFGVKVDANAVVSLARRPDEAHFRVKLRWDG